MEIGRNISGDVLLLFSANCAGDSRIDFWSAIPMAGLTDLSKLVRPQEILFTHHGSAGYGESVLWIASILLFFPSAVILLHLEVDAQRLPVQSPVW
jgi:hypothetical protein